MSYYAINPTLNRTATPFTPTITPTITPTFPTPIVPTGTASWHALLGRIGCGIAKGTMCGHPIAQPVYEAVCGPCGPAAITPTPGPSNLPFTPTTPTTTPTRFPQSGGCGCGNGRPAGTNKSGYWTRDGVYHPPGTKCVKRRRMNPLNPRALSRSISRIRSAKRATAFLEKVKVPKRGR